MEKIEGLPQTLPVNAPLNYQTQNYTLVKSLSQ